MKLFCTKRSPYARKVIVTALEKKIKLDLVVEDLTKKSSQLWDANPVGKIPVLVLNNGETLIDSPVLCEYIDSLNDNPILIPRKGEERFKVLNMSAIADGMMDVMVGLYMEKVRHPKDLNESFIRQQEETIARCLKYFESQLKDLESLTLIPIAVASAIGYMNFRLPEHNPSIKYPKLAKWFEEFTQRPSMASTQPVA
jgi:glutathione S-transferase